MTNIVSPKGRSSCLCYVIIVLRKRCGWPRQDRSCLVAGRKTRMQVGEEKGRPVFIIIAKGREAHLEIYRPIWPRSDTLLHNRNTTTGGHRWLVNWLMRFDWSTRRRERRRRSLNKCKWPAFRIYVGVISIHTTVNHMSCIVRILILCLNAIEWVFWYW